MEENIITERRLANGAQLRLLDRSKIMAGDRWLVKVVCQAVVKVTDALYPAQEELNLLSKIKAEMADEIVFAVTKEKIFIDQAEKEAAIAGLVEQINLNMLAYLESPAFPARFFAQRYAEIRIKCINEELNPVKDEIDDDEGPADFSACFQD